MVKMLKKSKRISNLECEVRILNNRVEELEKKLSNSKHKRRMPTPDINIGYKPRS